MSVIHAVTQEATYVHKLFPSVYTPMSLTYLVIDIMV